MPITVDFDYVKPGSLKEALEFFEKSQEARYLAGGTDLIPRLEENLESLSLMIDLKGISDLKGIRFDGENLRIGALATITEIIESKVIFDNFPLLYETAKFFASNSIRNRATIAGNICNAIPSADFAASLLVYKAKVNAEGRDGRREIPICSFFKSPRSTAMEKGEILTEIIIPQPPEKYAGIYLKLGRYEGEDLAQVGLAILMHQNGEFRIAYGAVAPTPVRARKIEALLKGRTIDENVVAEAKALVKDEISPITDIRSSKEYRLHMAEIMLERGLFTVAARLAGNGPKYGSKVI